MLSDNIKIRWMQIHELFNFVNVQTRAKSQCAVMNEKIIHDMVWRVTQQEEYNMYQIGCIVSSVVKE